MPEQLLDAAPHAGFDPQSYRLRSAPLTATVRDGDRVDLGDRTFEVLHLPGHSPGSIALWEAASHTLFSGDTIYDGPLLDNLPGSSIADYERSLERIERLEVETIHAGHDPSFGRERLHEIIASQRARWRSGVAAPRQNW